MEEEIFAWDGKSAKDIGAIFDRYGDEPTFLSTVLKLLEEPMGQLGASWLIKAWLEKGKTLDEAQTSKVFAGMDGLEHWGTKLHILQCLPLLSIHGSEKKRLEKFLRETLRDKNKFVRAWSYSGFYELARHHPEYQEETAGLLETAMRDEAPSVKARIRNVMKKGF